MHTEYEHRSSAIVMTGFKPDLHMVVTIPEHVCDDALERMICKYFL